MDIPDSVEIIDKFAFYGAGLTEINMSSDVEVLSGAFKNTPYESDGKQTEEAFYRRGGKLNLFEKNMREGSIKISLNESLGDYSYNDFDTFFWDEIGTDALGRKWYWTADKDTSSGICFYTVYEVGDDEFAIYEDYWLPFDYDEDEYEDLKYRACVEDAQSSDQWYGED